MGHHGRIGTKKERVRCTSCRGWFAPGRGMSIHRSKEHGDASKRFRVRIKGKWVYTKPRRVASQ